MKKHLISCMAGAVLASGLIFGTAFRSNAAMPASGFTTAPVFAAASNDDMLISDSVITLTVKNGTDITTELNTALKTARDMADQTDSIITVTVPFGSYTLSSTARIFSNTTLNLKGVTLTCADNGKFNMIISGTPGSYKDQTNYNKSDLCTGYDGFKNITINGGTLIGNSENTSSMIRLFHATNVNLSGITLSGGGCVHQMEVCAINGFYVKNCTFKNNGRETGVTNAHVNQEALQLDTPCKEAAFPGVVQDGTTMKNVEITGCKFQNVIRGIGSHTLLLGAYHENIKINNNTFNNVMEECIIGLNYRNCEIKNNTITNCGGGILFQNFKSYEGSVISTILDSKQPYKGKIIYDLNSVISDNTITLKYSPSCENPAAIKVFGHNQLKKMKGADGKYFPTGNYYITGVTVSNNNITTAVTGIHITDAWNCTFTNNTVTGKGFSAKDPLKNERDGIFIQSYAKGLVLSNNKVSGMTGHGIAIHFSSTAKDIISNTISNCGGYGIHIYQNSGCTGLLSKNKIKKCASGGISLSTNSTVADILSNTITGGCTDTGISLYNNCEAGKIKNNTITAIGKNAPAIKLSQKSASKTITGNKIQAGTAKYSCGRAIFLYNGSKVRGSIIGNAMENSNDTAICISTKSTVTGGVTNNQILSAGKYGLQVFNASTIKKTVSGNTIKKAATSGINICSTKNVLTIDKNTISGSSKAAIYVQPASTQYKVTVKNNTITGNKKGPGVSALQANIKVTGNKISKVTFGVYADQKCKGNIYSNKISKASRRKIYTATKKVKLKK